MSNMIIAYIVFGICTLLAVTIKTTQNNRTKTEQVLYKYGIETHDLETWRKRGMESTNNKNTKSILKHAESSQLLGMLFILYGWDLSPCK